MNSGYVYILTDKPLGTLYVGVTNNLVRRIFEHKGGLIDGFAMHYGLDRLVYFERFDSVVTAIRRERRLKKWNRNWKLRLIIGTNPEWRDLYAEIV